VGRSTKSRFDRLAKNTGRSRAFLAANEDHPTLHASLAIAYQSKTIADGDISTPVSSDRQPPSGGSFDDLKGLDVLMVEDSQDVGEAVRTLLESWGRTLPDQRRPPWRPQAWSPSTCRTWLWSIFILKGAN
jgi:hypothetical protein